MTGASTRTYDRTTLDNVGRWPPRDDDPTYRLRTTHCLSLIQLSLCVAEKHWHGASGDDVIAANVCRAPDASQGPRAAPDKANHATRLGSFIFLHAAEKQAGPSSNSSCQLLAIAFGR